MAVSQAYIFLWGTGIVFVILPHLNLGLLSDYKICGDSECQSLMSRVQAIRDHHGKDCRFLSFRRGDTIFVYHKLTGKREDLWAGSIDKQFGYFPKEAVKEELVYATMEKIVETQKSDFFCINEFGYPIDSSHLDTDDDDDSNQKIPIQGSETTQTSPYTDDTNVGSPSTSEDASTESPASAQESDGASTEENENKNDGDATAGIHEDVHETPAALNEQGGSPSSSWLSSSVTGWLGLAKEEEPANLAEGEKKDEIKETQAEKSFTSSVTGWLGLGGEGKPDDAKDSVNSQEVERETADSFTSTMTGWLGFGGEKKTEQEHDEEIEMDEEKEPAEKFRSRRLSLDLEANQLQGEEKKEMGTLGWLGNGLSSTLGFGLTNQESAAGRREAEEKSQEEEEQPASSSWLDLGITDILGFGKDKNEVDKTTRSVFKETEEDKTLEQPTDSQNVDTSQSQPALTDEAKTESSLERLEERVATKTETVLEKEDDSNISSSNKDTTETQLDQNLPLETQTQSGKTASVDADSNGKLEEKFQTVSSVPDSFFQIDSEKEEKGKISDDNKNKKNVVDEEKKTEMEGDDHQMPESVATECEVNGREPGEEIKTASDINQDFVPQNDITSGSVFGSEDLKSNSIGQSVSEAEEVKKDQLQDERTESADEEEAEIAKQIDNTEESTEMSVEIGVSGDDHKGEGSNEETDLFHREIPTTLRDESAEQSQVSGDAEDSSGGSLPFLSSDTAEEKNEPVPSEDDSLTVDHSDTQSIEAQSVEGSSQEFGSSHTTNRSAEMHEHASEEDRGTFSSRENILNPDTNMDNIDLASASPQTQKMATNSEGDADKLKETENSLQPAQAEKETLDFEKDRKSETEAETEEESKEEEKQEEIEELKEGETQDELKEVGEMKEEDKQEDTEELKERENREAVDELKRDEKQEEVEELKKDEKWEGVEELKEEREQKELKELGEMKEEDKQEDAEELKEEENQAVDELKRDEKQEEVEELKKDEKWEGVEELKEETKQEEVGGLSEEERQQEVEEIKEEKKKEVVEESREEEKQQEVEEVKEEKKKEVVEGLKKEQKQEELKEEEKQEDLEEVEKGLHSSPHNQNDIGNEKEIQDENDLESAFSEASEKTEKSPTKSFQAEEERGGEEKQETVEEVKEEEKREVEVQQQAKDVEDETRSKEKEESLKCSNELCSQSVQDERHDSEDGLSSAYEGTIQTGEQNPVDESDQILSARTEESEGISFESDKHRIRQEEKMKNEMDKKRNDDAKADVRGKEQVETKNNEENEHIGSNSANGISDLNFEVDQKGEIEHTDNEVPYSGENDHRLPNESLDNLYSGETKNADLCNDVDMKCAGDTSTIEKITEQIHSDDHNRGTAEAESGGAFGLFKNAFSFFGKTPITDIKESTEPALSLDTNAGEISQPQASLTPEQEPDSTPDTASSQVYIADLHPDSPAFAEIQPSSMSLMQTPSQPSSLSPNTATPLKPKTPSKHDKTLLDHMSVDETTILVELFGRHKLQFLDYILGRSEPTGEDPDNDESILLDIETLLHHHRETLFAPSMRLTDALQEDKENTRTLITLQKLEMLLERVRETFKTRKSDISRANHQAEASCVDASCLTHSKDQEMTTRDESRKTGDSSVGLDDNIRRDEGMEQEEERDGQLSGGTGKEKETEKRGEMGRGGKEERVSPEETSNKVSHNQPGSPQPLEGVMKQILDFVHQIAEDSSTHVRAGRELLVWLTVQVVSSLPDDIRPGPDLYGVPWEPIIISSLVGLVTMLLFSCRCYSSVKSRMYRSKERWMAEQVAQLLDEKCKVLETLSKCQQEYDELEISLRDSGVLAQTQKTEHLEVKARQLEHAKRELERDLDQLKDQLDQQREHRIEQERRIAVLEESMKTCEEETKDLQSQEEQAQTTLKVYSMNSDRLQRNLETAGEENTLLQESNAQFRQQVEGWAERVSELEEEMRRCELTYSGMVQDVANKDERIMSLTDRLLRMKAWDSDLEEERGEEGGEETSNGTAGKGEENGKGDNSQGHLQKVQKLIYAAKLNADLKSVDEDKDRVFAKLNDEVKAKEDLEVSIKELENEKLFLQSDSERYSDQVQRLQQKLNIMTEMYQENELKLHRLLTVEEKERLQKEEKLNKADKNIALAMEELHNYRRRAEEMEEELEKTRQSYQTQISAHEKKAHNNWLAARAADRDLSVIRRENALFRQKLTDTQFKLDALDKDPYALHSLARPLPFRAERSPYGPSPLGRPTSETRPFLSPPTLMDGPPARLSPRVSRGPVEPLGGQGEMERSGGPHSDSGSISPTWERDRRGPPPGPPGSLGPPGYMFTEPGGPMYRRPIPPPGAMGILPPPGSLPLGPPLPHPRGFPPAGPPGPPHPADMADGSYRENSLGPGEQDHRESGPGDRRTPPEADPRIGGALPPGPPMGPMDGPFPRRGPYGPPPPDFYPPRGPGGPPMMPMWAPPPPGMMFPPRFPPGGPPHHHMPSYGHPMRPPPPDGLLPPSMGPPPPQQSLPSLPHRQSPEEHTPSPQDLI